MSDNNLAIIALEFNTSFAPETPGLFRRTYALGLLLGFFVAAIAGLFDYNCQAWVYSKGRGFRPFVFSKRRPLLQIFELPGASLSPNHQER